MPKGPYLSYFLPRIVIPTPRVFTSGARDLARDRNQPPGIRRISRCFTSHCVPCGETSIILSFPEDSWPTTTCVSGLLLLTALAS